MADLRVLFGLQPVLSKFRKGQKSALVEDLQDAPHTLLLRDLAEAIWMGSPPVQWHAVCSILKRLTHNFAFSKELKTWFPLSTSKPCIASS